MATHRLHNFQTATAEASRLQQLLARPAKPLSAEQLERAVRLLAVCSAQRERSLIMSHLYHGRPLHDAAAAVGITPAQAADLFNSVCNREKEATAEAERAELLEKAFAPRGRRWLKRRKG